MMSINEEQIRRILGQAETEDKAVSMLLTLLQPKTTSTDIEEVERAIEKAIETHAKVALPDQSVTRQSTDYHEGFEDACLQWDLIMTDLPHKIMLELAPHLSNKSELKKEAVREFIKDIVNEPDVDTYCKTVVESFGRMYLSSNEKEDRNE